VALSFVSELKYMHLKHEFHVVLSKALESQIDKNDFPDTVSFYNTASSPARLTKRRGIVRKLARIEEMVKPQVVFTVFGPSYWRPKARHYVGFADGWVYYPKSYAYGQLTIAARLFMRMKVAYKKYYLRKDSDAIVMETEDAKAQLSKTANIPRSNIYVVGNACSSAFDDPRLLDENNEYYKNLGEKSPGEYRLVYIAHNHPNKNLGVIREVVKYLEDLNVVFYLTLDAKSFKQLFKNGLHNVVNIGPIPQRSCPSVYHQCDALFAPTLLETFSASYPEAMKMQRPILTSGLSFARDVCDDAAVYFDPLDPEDIAEKIKMLVLDKELQKRMIELGVCRAVSFNTARARALEYIRLCENIGNGVV